MGENIFSDGLIDGFSSSDGRVGGIQFQEGPAGRADGEVTIGLRGIMGRKRSCAHSHLGAVRGMCSQGSQLPPARFFLQLVDTPLDIESTAVAKRSTILGG